MSSGGRCIGNLTRLTDLLLVTLGLADNLNYS
jgi:hypothetical protein